MVHSLQEGIFPVVIKCALTKCANGISTRVSPHIAHDLFQEKRFFVSVKKKTLISDGQKCF